MIKFQVDITGPKFKAFVSKFRKETGLQDPITNVFKKYLGELGILDWISQNNDCADIFYPTDMELLHGVLLDKKVTFTIDIHDDAKAILFLMEWEGFFDIAQIADET